MSGQGVCIKCCLKPGCNRTVIEDKNDMTALTCGHPKCDMFMIRIRRARVVNVNLIAMKYYEDLEEYKFMGGDEKNIEAKELLVAKREVYRTELRHAHTYAISKTVEILCKRAYETEAGGLAKKFCTAQPAEDDDNTSDYGESPAKGEQAYDNHLDQGILFGNGMVPMQQ